MTKRALRLKRECYRRRRSRTLHLFLFNTDTTVQRKKHTQRYFFLPLKSHKHSVCPLLYSKTCKISTFIKGQFFCLLFIYIRIYIYIYIFIYMFIMSSLQQFSKTGNCAVLKLLIVRKKLNMGKTTTLTFNFGPFNLLVLYFDFSAWFFKKYAALPFSKLQSQTAPYCSWKSLNYCFSAPCCTSTVTDFTHVSSRTKTSPMSDSWRSG